MVVHDTARSCSLIGLSLKEGVRHLGWHCEWINLGSQLDGSSCGLRIVALVVEFLAGGPFTGKLTKAFVQRCLDVLIQPGVNNNTMDELIQSSLEKLAATQDETPTQALVARLCIQAMDELDSMANGMHLRKKRRSSATTRAGKRATLEQDKDYVYSSDECIRKALKDTRKRKAPSVVARKKNNTSNEGNNVSGLSKGIATKSPSNPEQLYGCTAHVVETAFVDVHKGGSKPLT